jgi:cytochrome oxidase Cu insertion factor (SCO1/SenC/PrrC family)
VTARRALVALACAAIAGIVAGVAIGSLRRTHPTRTALPAFHGQASWRAGARPAPPFALRDQTGTLVSLHALRGRPVLLTFLDSQCTSECPIAGRELGSILRRLPASRRPALVVISVDPRGDTPAAVRHALAKWKLDGPWTVHWLNAPTRATLARVWKSFDVVVQPATNDIMHSLALYLIDRNGDERTGYLFPFLQSFVQHDIVRLSA